MRVGQRMAIRHRVRTSMTQQMHPPPVGGAPHAEACGAEQHRPGSCTWRLPALPVAAAMTRRHLRHLLQEGYLAVVADTVQLIASELVANAVRAAQAPG